jgi:hypothetical protein
MKAKCSFHTVKRPEASNGLRLVLGLIGEKRKLGGLGYNATGKFF